MYKCRKGNQPLVTGGSDSKKLEKIAFFYFFLFRQETLC